MLRRSSVYRPETEDRAEKLSEVESRLHARLIPRRNKEAIQIDDPAFGFYDPQKRAKDKDTMERKRGIHARKDAAVEAGDVQAIRGKVFEAVVEDQIMSSDWMGPEANVIVPSEYDDYVNFVDTIIEFERPGQISHLALGADITSSEESVHEKFAGIKASIDQGTMSMVEYYKSANFTGRLERVPRVIIGANRKTRTEVAELVLRFKLLQENSAANSDAQKEEFKKIRQKLADHPLQYKILHGIQVQLEAFGAYARKIGKDDLALVYENSNQIIRNILKLKEAVDKQELEQEDDVYRLIVQYAREIARSAKS